MNSGGFTLYKRTNWLGWAGWLGLAGWGGWAGWLGWLRWLGLLVRAGGDTRSDYNLRGFGHLEDGLYFM